MSGVNSFVCLIISGILLIILTIIHPKFTEDYVLKLYNKLSDKYKTGQLTKDQLRFAIRRLELKL